MSSPDVHTQVAFGTEVRVALGRLGYSRDALAYSGDALAVRYMLDTNVVIYTIRNRPEEVRRMFTLQQGHICVSTVTLMELIYGAEKSTQPHRNLRDVEAFSARLDVLPYDLEAANHTGRIRAELARSGEPIGPYDAMIAGHARSRGLTVVTANTREFERVPGLVVENWVGE